jgi:paraquat-inducible protein A
MLEHFSRTRRAMLPWPKPKGGPHYSVCHFCDAVLYQNRPASLVRATAFSLSSLILMVVVHFFPFLIMDAEGGFRMKLNLTTAARALIHEGSPILGGGLALFTIIAPIAMASGLIYVCAPLMFGRAAPGAIIVAKWLNKTEPWNMVEVFLIGILVSLLKLAKVAEVHFGMGFWAFGALMLCMAAAIASIDRDELWDRLEVAKA